MGSKERENGETEKVFFRSLGMWQSVTQEQATGCFGHLDLTSLEGRQILWREGPRKGLTSESVSRIIWERTGERLAPKKLRQLPLGTWLTWEGEIHLKE